MDMDREVAVTLQVLRPREITVTLTLRVLCPRKDQSTLPEDRENQGTDLFWDRFVRSRFFMLRRGDLRRSLDDLLLVKQRLLREASRVITDHMAGPCAALQGPYMDRFYTDSVSHLENVLRSDRYSHLQMMPAEMACKVIVRRRDRYDILPEAAIGHPSDSRAFPAAQEAVDSPEKTNIDGGSQEGLGGAGEPCAICFEDMNLREGGVACMPCKHKLHRNCLARWLKMSNLCPLCRSAMLAGRPA